MQEPLACSVTKLPAMMGRGNSIKHVKRRTGLQTLALLAVLMLFSMLGRLLIGERRTGFDAALEISNPSLAQIAAAVPDGKIEPPLNEEPKAIVAPPEPKPRFIRSTSHSNWKKPRPLRRIYGRNTAKPRTRLTNTPGKLQEETIPLNGYNISSVPLEILQWILDFTVTGECEEAPDSLITRCCAAHCGGMSDRLRGLATLILVAEKANRRLCITRDYFIPNTVAPSCDGGNFIYLTHDTIVKYPSGWSSMKRKNRPSPQYFKMTNRHQPDQDNPARNARYISTVRTVDIEKYNIIGRVDNKRLGLAALAVSDVLSQDVRKAQRSLAQHLGRPINHFRHVSLHVRCGASSFKTTGGNEVKATDKWKDGYETEGPNLLLESLRSIPEDTKCRIPLYIASDSQLYKNELRVALPKGIRVISCCGEPLHIGFVYDGKAAENLGGMSQIDKIQHLVDLEALGTSDVIFRTVGGFAETGTLAKTWAPVPSVRWPGAGEHDPTPTTLEREEFIDSFLESLGCE